VNLYDKLIAINSAVTGINLQEIRNDNDVTVGWNAVVETSSSNAFSGGTCGDQETAIRIAIAECFERSFFLKISQLEDVSLQALLLDQHPSSSGFACGFEPDTTRFRSICEGIERWAWSQWIDYSYKIKKVDSMEYRTSLGDFLASKFDKFTLFSHDIYFQFQQYKFVLFIGEKSNGVFAGSRVSTSKDSLIWEHAIIEAYRNLENFKLFQNQSSKKIEDLDIISARARYFGSHADEAWAQVSRAEKQPWIAPEVNVSSYIDTKVPGVFLHRCLMKNFIGWHLGSCERFVY
jgi:hypothetical protein